METRRHSAPHLGNPLPAAGEPLNRVPVIKPRVAGATRICIGAVGLLAAVAAVEHGIGEIAQGSRASGSVVFTSWPDSPAFASLGGEPAMSLVPNLAASGVLTIIVGCILGVFAVGFSHRRHAGLILAGVSVLLLLVGGGFGPPLLGLILALTTARAAARARPPGRVRRRLSRAWRPLLVITVLALLGLFPGMVVLYWLAEVESGGLVAVLTMLAFGGLALTMLAALTHDRLHPTAR